MDVNRKVKFFKKKIDVRGGGGVGVGWGSGGSIRGLVGEVGVARFGVGGVWGM